MASAARVSTAVAILVGRSLAVTTCSACQDRFNEVCAQLFEGGSGSNNPAATLANTASETAWAGLLKECPACDDARFVMSGFNHACKAGTHHEMSAEECEAYAESKGIPFLFQDEHKMNIPCKSCVKPSTGHGNSYFASGGVTYIPEGQCKDSPQSKSHEWEQVCKSDQASPTPYACPAAPARLYTDMPRVVVVVATSIPAGLVAALLLALIVARRSAFGRPWAAQRIDEGSSTDCPDLREPALTPHA